jgi:Icc protein
MLIAQISDIHLVPEGELAYEAADTANALGKVVDHINGLVPTPDVVIVTGDIADGGRLDSYHRGPGTTGTTRDASVHGPW